MAYRAAINRKGKNDAQIKKKWQDAHDTNDNTDTTKTYIKKTVNDEKI